MLPCRPCGWWLTAAHGSQLRLLHLERVNTRMNETDSMQGSWTPSRNGETTVGQQLTLPTASGRGQLPCCRKAPAVCSWHWPQRRRLEGAALTAQRRACLRRAASRPQACEKVVLTIEQLADPVSCGPGDCNSAPPASAEASKCVFAWRCGRISAAGL